METDQRLSTVDKMKGSLLMLENLRKSLMMGIGYNMLYAAVNRMADDDDNAPSVLELDESLDEAERPAELAPGTYVGECQDVQTPVSGKGNKYYNIKFVIPPEEIGADQRDDFPDGATLYWNRNLVPKKGDRRALFNLRRLIEAFGLDSKTTTIDPNEWMGCKARLKIVMGKWEGEDRAEIRSVEAAEAQAAPRSKASRDTRGADAPSPRGRAASSGRRGR